MSGRDNTPVTPPPALALVDVALTTGLPGDGLRHWQRGVGAPGNLGSPQLLAS
jgi:hypothetical protein